MGKVRWTRVVAFGALVFCWSAGILPAWAVPTAVPYVGYLTDTDGTPLNETVDIRVALFDAQADGQQIWPPGATAQEFTGLEVFDGVVGLVLGDADNPLDALALADAAELWLAVEVRASGDETYTALTPRQPLLAVPYALVAADAQSLGGQPAAR